MMHQDAAVKEFMVAMGSAHDIDFRTDQDFMYLKRVLDLQLDLINEEYEETMQALYAIRMDLHNKRNPDRQALIELADGIADLKYVLSHCANAMSIDSERAFEIVHKSNMSKVGLDGKVTRDPRNGKVLKPNNYQPPILWECIK